MKNQKKTSMEAKDRGLRLVTIRKTVLHSSQEQLGKLLGNSISTVSGWELGRAEPELKIWIRIAELGNVSLDWLLTGKEEKSHKPVNQKSIFPNRHMQDIAGWINEQIEPEIYWGELKAALIDRHPKFETYLKKQNRDGGEDGDHKKISTGQR